MSSYNTDDLVNCFNSLTMITKVLLFLLLALVTVVGQAQTNPKKELAVEVQDGFLNEPLEGVRVSICREDSTVLVDSVNSMVVKKANGKVDRIIHYATVNSDSHHFLFHAKRKGYSDAWQSVIVTDQKVETTWAAPIKMQKIQEMELDEVVVKATKVKMYHNGDTLVYNADAFNLPNGSMLDALIKQLPGVTMNKQGEIFVNGKKIDELLLGSQSFMSGKKDVLMQNLPYYTVKHIKVYDKQTDRSESLGWDIDPKKYVMDVNLKREYQRGYIANLEGAGGTKNRWLGRVFLLGFTDLWRYSVMGNVNNVNENRHIGEHDHWTPAKMPTSLLTTRSAAIDLDYQSRNKNVKNNFNADYTSTSNDNELRVNTENFLGNTINTSTSEALNNNSSQKLSLDNRLVLNKPFYNDYHTIFIYQRHHGGGFSLFNQLDEQDSLTASMRTRNISKGHVWSIQQEISGIFNLNKEKRTTLDYGLFFRHSADQSWDAKRYSTWQNTTRVDAIRHNANDIRSQQTSLMPSMSITFNSIVKNITLNVGENFQYFDNKSHDYLYHPDTLMLPSQLDMLEAITDPANSYDSRQKTYRNTINLSLSKKGSYHHEGNDLIKITYDQIAFHLKVPIVHQSFDYQRGIIDTLARQTEFFFIPSLQLRHVWPGGKNQASFRIAYNQEEADLTNKINYRDDSQPLIVVLGNPHLKGRMNTDLRAEFSSHNYQHQQMFSVSASANFVHRATAESMSYDARTGVYTYMPKNVSGAYQYNGNISFSSSLDKNQYWSWQTNFDAGYDHSVDYTMLSGETESHRNVVNTTTLHDGAFLQWNKGSLNLRAVGDITWRHSTGKMRDFTTLNAWDYHYGLIASYTIPILKTSVAADGTMYSRRGYGSSALNTDDFVLNASLSQTFLKGKLIARVEAFDLLHQLSSMKYEVNAQGRTETWFRSLPHYIMFHLVYHWNKNPKKH